jgi:predicted outer membrane repeat protein
MTVQVLPGTWKVEVKAYDSGGSLRAINTTSSVNVSPGESSQADINMVSITEVTSWADLKIAAQNTIPAGTPTDREEIIVVKGTTDSPGPLPTITIVRKVTIIVESPQTFTRDTSPAGPLFNVSGANAALTLEGDLTLNGGNYSPGSYPLVNVTSGGFVLDGATLTGGNNMYPGGAVAVSGGSFTMKSGNITGNESGYGGGGVSVSSGSFTLKGGTISDNDATGGGGGGVYLDDTSFIMEDGNIGLSTSNRNTALYRGGGIYGVNSSSFTMYGGTITGNDCGTGGGIYLENSNFTMENGNIGLSTSNGNTGTMGGGVFVDTGIFTMKGGNIRGNSGGGVWVIGTFNLYGGNIGGSSSQKNTATGGGGAIVNGTFNMTGGTISGNASTGGHGGGVAFGGGTFTMYGGTISGNTTSSAGGAGVYLDTGTFKMYNGATITGNIADGNGGGVLEWKSTFFMYGGVIANNSASSGGGVHLFDINTTFTMSGGTITGNTVSLNGGGIGGWAPSSSTINISGTALITNNTAERDGGGIYLTEVNCYMTGGTISGNKTTAILPSAVGYGGGICLTGEGAVFTKTGGVLYGDTDQIHTPNSTENTASNDGHAVFIRFSPSPMLPPYGTPYNGTYFETDNLTVGP